MSRLPLPILCLFLIAINAQADIADGIKAYNSGNYQVARTEFTAAAKADDPMGIHLLASLYYQGHGVEKDVAKAVKLFALAAKGGFRASQANLGLMYHNGDGVEKDIEKAIKYYEAAGKQGDLQSAFNLGQIYRMGDGVVPDLKKAARYYQFAAQLGNVSAANEFGLMFAQGNGVKLDFIEAYGWIAFAVKGGSQDAVKNLEKLKELLGDRVPQGEARAIEIEAAFERVTAPKATSAGKKDEG